MVLTFDNETWSETRSGLWRVMIITVRGGGCRATVITKIRLRLFHQGFGKGWNIPKNVVCKLKKTSIIEYHSATVSPTNTTHLKVDTSLWSIATYGNRNNNRTVACQHYSGESATNLSLLRSVCIFAKINMEKTQGNVTSNALFILTGNRLWRRLVFDPLDYQSSVRVGNEVCYQQENQTDDRSQETEVAATSLIGFDKPFASSE